MGFHRRLVSAVVRAENALDRAKLAYKARFDRFDPARILPYRGWGRADALVIRARVMEATEVGIEPGESVWSNIRNTVRRLETDEIRGARVRARFRELEVEARADEEAFVDFRLEPSEPVEPGWQDVRLEIVESMASEDTGPVTGRVLVPPADADFIVVSDLDDTVVRSGAHDQVTLARTVLLNDSHTRLPFHGVAALYRALAAGPGGGGANPLFYLSRSAWNLYQMLERFLDAQGLPEGPILLKDHGLRGLLGADDDEQFKDDRLEELARFYPDASFVLLGDSGQEDPEVYRRFAERNPGRVRGILIRDVTEPERDREVHAIARAVRRAGTPMALVRDSEEAALHAVELGLIVEDALGRVEAERESDEPAPGFLRRWLSGERDGDDAAPGFLRRLFPGRDE